MDSFAEGAEKHKLLEIQIGIITSAKNRLKTISLSAKNAKIFTRFCVDMVY
jgi:hypothetical protein